MVFTACHFWKQSNRPDGSDMTQTIEYNGMDTKKGDLFHGHRISVDHYLSTVPGWLYNSRGGSQ